MKNIKYTNKEDNPYVYIPSSGTVNTTNQLEKPPKTRYDNRQVILNRNIVKEKVTKGKDIS